MMLRKYVLINNLTGYPVNEHGKLKRFFTVRGALRYRRGIYVRDVWVGGMTSVHKIMKGQP